MISSGYVSMVIHLLLIVLGLIFRKSRFISIVMAVWLFVLIGFNYGGPDILAYQGMYDFFGNSNVYHFFGLDQLYGSWWMYSKSMGWDMMRSNAILTAMLSLVLFRGIRLITPYSARVYSLLFIFPISDLVIQRRNFAAMVFVIYGIHWLNAKYKFGYLKYALAVIVASGFHQMALPFLVFAIVPFLDKKESIKKTVKYSLIGGVLALIGVKYSGMLFSADKIQLYTEDATNRLPLWKAAVYMVIHVVLVGIVYMNYKTGRKGQENDVANQDFESRTKYLIIMSVISLAFMPLYAYNSAFFRYLRSLLPAIYAINSLDFSSAKIRYLNSVYIYSFAIFLFMFSYVAFGNIGFSGLVAPVFNQNAVFDYVSMYVF